MIDEKQLTRDILGLENLFDEDIERIIDTIDRQTKINVWHDPTDPPKVNGKQYLAELKNGSFEVVRYHSNLYEVDNYDFDHMKGQGGFYGYDSEWGYYRRDVIAWQEIWK